jgi:membrane protease YdiL (CAAX protease family)
VPDVPRFTESRPARPGARALALVLVPLSALAAPAVHRGLVAAGLDLDFAQTLRRCLLVGVVSALLWAFRPWREVPPDLWGLRGPRARPRLLVLGALLAVSMLLATTLLEAALGRFSWDRERGGEKFWDRLPATVLGGVAIALLEEAFFRGWLLERLRRRLALATAVFLGALLFALPHAFRGTAAPADLPASLDGVGRALAAWGRNLADVSDFGPRFVGLVLLAILLSAGALRTGSLLFPIGIHFGAHVYLQQASALTHRTPERDWLGSKWLYDGPVLWVVMAALAWATWPRRAGGEPTATAVGFARSEPSRAPGEGGPAGGLRS